MCPAGPIHITFEQSRRPDRSLGQVPATSVIPWSGGFSAQLRLPDDAHLGRGTLRFVQREREVSSWAVPDSRYAGERGYGVRVAPTTGAPCTPANGCAPASDPTLELVRPPGPPYQPGGAVRVVGHGYPDPLSDTYRPPKQSRFVQLISYYLTDASGSAWRLDAGEVERDGDIAATIGLPSWRLAPGRASPSAVPIGYEGHPVCGRPGTTTFTITLPRPTLTFTTLPVAGASVTLSGTSWADRPLRLARRRRARPPRRQARAQACPARAAGRVQGDSEGPARQGREPDPRGPAARAGSGRPARAPAARPLRPPPEDDQDQARDRAQGAGRAAVRAGPDRAPRVHAGAHARPGADPTLEARQASVDSVRLDGAHWERGDCAGRRTR